MTTEPVVVSVTALPAAQDSTVSAPRRVRPGKAGVGAHDRERLVDGQVLVVGARRDDNGVAGRGRVDRCLDRGVAAIAHEQEVVACRRRSIFSTPEKGVGTLGAAGRHDEVAEAVVLDHRSSDRSGVGRGIGPAAANEVSLPPPPLRTLATSVADDGVVALAAGGVLDVDQHVGADVDAFRVADRRSRRVASGGTSSAPMVSAIGPGAIVHGLGVERSARLRSTVSRLVADG